MITRHVGQRQLADDVDGDGRRRRGGERQHGRRAERSHDVGEAEVVRAEIVAPLAEAMRFVDDEQIDVRAGQLLAQLGAGELLRSGEEELGALVADLRVRLPGHVGRHRAIDLGRGHAERDQLVVLVPHQRDQRRHDDRHPRQEERGQLIAERLAGAGRHHRQRVPAGQHRIDHGALAGPELSSPNTDRSSSRILRAWLRVTGLP
jgi:hypothetical protein